MLESVLVDVLNRFVGAYVRNIQAEQLRVAVWAGNVVLSHLEVRPDALRELDLPITVVKGAMAGKSSRVAHSIPTAGVVGKLTLTVPWANLKSKPIILVLDDVHLLARPTTDAATAEEELARRQRAKRQRLRDMEQFVTDFEAPRPSQGNTDALSGSVVAKLVDNIQVIINNIHIRLEDKEEAGRGPLAIGLTVQRCASPLTRRAHRSLDEPIRPPLILTLFMDPFIFFLHFFLCAPPFRLFSVSLHSPPMPNGRPPLSPRRPTASSAN